MCLLAEELRHQNFLACDRLLTQYYTAVFSYVEVKLRLHRARKRIESRSDTSFEMLEHQVKEYRARKNKIRDELTVLGVEPDVYKALNYQIQKKLK